MLSWNGSLEVWDVITGTMVHSCVGCGESGIFLGVLRGDFVVVTRDGNVRSFPLGFTSASSSVKGVRVFNVGGNPISAAALHGVEGVLAVGGREHDAEVWCVADGERLWAAKNLPDSKLDLRVPIWVTALAFLRENTLLDGVVVGGSEVCADGQTRLGPLSPFLLAVATGYRSLRLYDTKNPSRRPLRSIEGAGAGDYPLTALVLSPSGHHLVTGDTAGYLKRWDLPTLHPSGSFAGHVGAIKSLCAHPTLPYITSASLDRSLLVWNVETRQLLRRLHLKQRLHCALFVPSGGDKVATSACKEVEGMVPEGARAGAGKKVKVEALKRMHGVGGVDEGAMERREGDEGDDDVWAELERRGVEAKKVELKAKRTKK